MDRQLATLVFMAMAIKAEILQVLFLNTLQTTDWKEGFDLFNSFLEETHGGFSSAGVTYQLNVTECNERLQDFNEADAVLRIRGCLELGMASEVMVVASTSYHSQIQQLVEAEQMPNVHCAGGNPLLWTSDTPHAFGLPQPVTLYSQETIRQAAARNLKSVVVLRDDAELQRLVAVGACEWLRKSGTLRLIGPTVAWCTRWSSMTRSCSIDATGSACRCGAAVEFESLGYRYDSSLPSFYEVSPTRLGGTSLVSFVEGVIQDVRAQGEDPDLVLNLLSSEQSGLAAMKGQGFNYQMYYSASADSASVASADAMYHLGSAQWLPELQSFDPFFGSTQGMVDRYTSQFGRAPSAESAACAAAGVSLAHALQKYGRSMETMDLSQRREEIRRSLGQLNDETFFGRIHFDRNNQNVGRSPITWQLLEDAVRRPVLPAEFSTSSLRFPAPSWAVRQGCPAGTAATGTGPLPTACTPCQAGTFSSSTSAALNFSSCEPCPAGRGVTSRNVTGLAECPVCPPGRFNPGGAPGLCEHCPLGSASPTAGSAACELCGVDRYANETGMEQCQACSVGSSQPESGRASCVCDIGFYRDDSARKQRCERCDVVLPGGTTVVSDSGSEDCICPAGTYWYRPTAGSPLAFCEPCLSGLICPGGAASTGRHQAALQARGYAAGAPQYPGGAPPYIIACSDNRRCPGNLPLGECPANSFGIACTQCRPGFYDSDGVCSTCSDPIALVPMLVALSFVVVALGGFYVFATRMDKSHRDSLFMIIFSAGLTFVTVNSLPIFSKIEVQLVEPLRSLRLILLFISLDFDLLRPDCWMSSGQNPVWNFLGTMALYPFGSIALLVLFAIAKYCLKKDVTFFEVKYAHGILILALYVLMTALTMRPFRCVLNPDGTSSLGYHRDVICWRDDHHFMMVAFSFLPFFGVVVSFAAMICIMVLRYPRKIGRQGGAKFVKKWSFIFGHFVPKRYYFGLVFTLRNFLLGVLPAIFITQHSLLILSLTFTMCLYGFIQAKTWPWKTSLANFIDAGLAVLTVLVLILATTLLDFDVEQELLRIQILSMILTVLVFLGALIALIISIYKSYKPTKTYGIFLSHHKMGAGCLARWVKMIMSEFIKDRIFLDSDDVNKLDAIMDVTAYDTENVVVLLTSETLKRMWCAAEIACAWHAGTNTVFLSCDGNQIDEELLSLVPRLWNEEQEATLMNAGVTVEMIDTSYHGLRHSSFVHLDRHGAVERAHQNAVQQLLMACRGLTRRKFASTRVTVSGRRMSADGLMPFMILSDLRTPEVGCCARVIMYLLRNHLQEDFCVYDPYDVVDDLESFQQEMEGTAAILVLLTQGMLQDCSFAGIMAACPEHCRESLVPIRADESFVYPDPGFWEHLAEGKVFEGQTLAEMNTDFEGVRVAYAKLFNVLALKFTQHGSEHIQRTEIAIMAERLAPMLAASPQTRDTGGSMRRIASDRLSDRPSRGGSKESSKEASLTLGPPELELPEEHVVLPEVEELMTSQGLKLIVRQEF